MTSTHDSFIPDKVLSTKQRVKDFYRSCDAIMLIKCTLNAENAILWHGRAVFLVPLRNPSSTIF